MSRWRRLLLAAPFLVLPLCHAPAPVRADEAAPGLCAAIDDATRSSVVQVLHGADMDPAKIGALLEPNVVYTTPLWGVVTGREAVTEAFAKLQESFSGFSLEAQEVLVEDPYVVVRYTLSGTHMGEFEDMPATGNDVEATGIAVYRLHCGMIGEAWTHFDHLGLMAQIDPAMADFAPSEPMASPERDLSCAPPTHEDMQTLVREMYTEAWTRTPDFPAVLAPDVVLHSALGPDLEGFDAVEPLRKNYFLAFPNLAYRHGEVIVDGDLASTWWTASGTDEGGFMGKPATGKPMLLDGITIYRAECGKIVEIWTESDLAAVMEQLSAGE